VTYSPFPIKIMSVNLGPRHEFPYALRITDCTGDLFNEMKNWAEITFEPDSWFWWSTVHIQFKKESDRTAFLLRWG
jgi:hypothetical protein